MNKAKYWLVNGDSIIGIVYESDKYGRTLVLTEKIDVNYPINIYSTDKVEVVEETDFIEFIHSLLPVN
jgi:hypothetical protein